MTAVEECCSHSSFSGSQHAGGWQSGSLLAVTEDFFTLGGVAEWGTTKGMETQSLELSTSPLKKFKGLGIEETSKGRMVDLWRSMGFKETCLVVERDFLAEKESREVPCEAHDMRELLEDVSETDQDQSLVNKAGKMARGGGG
ncbi:hypothetical protein PS1_012082 [Malus domestica]